MNDHDSNHPNQKSLAFHKHLENCPTCQAHWKQLCPEGHKLLIEAAKAMTGDFCG